MNIPQFEEVAADELSGVEGGVVPLLAFGAYAVLTLMAAEYGVLTGIAISRMMK